MSAENVKAPSQVFRWFEKMKSNYEQSIKTVLSRFEQYNEKQQARLDASHLEHINNLKDSHLQLQNQQQSTIARLEADIAHYKQQVAQQQQTIEQLNNRYDAVITTFLQNKQNTDDVLDIAAETTHPDIPQNTIVDMTVASTANEDNNTRHKSEASNHVEITATEPVNQETASVENTEEESIKRDQLYEQALLHREEAQFEESIPLFSQAAELGCAKSMGALGRAFFLAEGVEQDPIKGLAWLVLAANKGLPQAIDKVSMYKSSEPEMYQDALAMSESMLN